VTLKEDANRLKKVVVVGYGSKSKTVDADNIVESAEIIIGFCAEKEIIINTVTFKIKKSYAIPSLNPPSSIKINTFTIPAAFEYYAAPILDKNVYLTT
jgi:hypothetical protein